MKRKRLIIFLSIWIVFQCLLVTLYLQSHGRDNAPNLVPLVAFVGAPLGPFASGIARPGQTCCVQASLVGFGYCLPFAMLIGVGLFGNESSRKIRRVLALAIWGIGWFGWMLAAFFTLGHALS